MKKFSGLCFALSSGLLLASCQLTVYPDQFYRVDYYSDYVGIEVDYTAHTFKEDAATLLGHAFAKRPLITLDSDQQTTLTTYYGVDEPTKLEEGVSTDYRKSTREVPVGHEWVFRKWAGYYEDGSEVNLSQIKGDCSVFAIFDAVPINYSVTIEGLSSNADFYRVDFGEKLKDNEEYASHPLDSDPASDYTDPYYQTSPLSGLKYMVNDVDRSSEVTSPYYQFIANTPIEGNTKFIFQYADPIKHEYTVRYRAISDDDTPVELIPWTEQVVVYDEPLVKPTELAEEDWSFIKSVGVYDAAAKADNPKLDKVDIDAIRHNCEVTLVYRKKAHEYNIRIYDDTGTNLLKTEKSFEGAPAILSAPTVGAGKTWTGEFAIKDTNQIYDKATLVTGDLDLVPLAVPTEVSKEVTLLDQTTSTDIPFRFSYMFNRGDGGYRLNNIEDLSDPSLVNDNTVIELTAEKIAYSNDNNYVNKTYAVTSIESFGVSTVAQTFSSVALPNTIQYLLGTSFRGLTNVKTIDLRLNTQLMYVGDYCFDRLSSVDDIYLPSSLQHIGDRIINDCKYLQNGHLHIDLTEAEVAQMIADNNAAEKWNYIDETEFVAVDYKVA